LNSSGNHHAATEADFTPLAIVGMGGIFPQAENLMQFWHNIRDGVDSITDIPSSHWNPAELYDPDPKKPDHVYGNKGGFLPPVDFEPMKYGVLPNALEAIDTSQLLGLVAVEQALNDAGYGTTASFDREKVSVILGVTGALELVVPLGARLGHPRWRKALQEAGVDDDTAQDVIDRIGDSYTQWQENSFPGLLGNVVAGRISKHFNFGGTNCVVDAACGSSLSAINLAALELATGRADMVVTGGVDTFNDVFMYSCFSKTPALSPSGHARPFDADADGTTLGEAIGIVVLKRLSDAERDGDRIYAVIKGLGTSSDGSDSAIYEPDASGQQKAVLRAYEQADVAPRSVGMIEAHGTGTRVGDGIEVKALQQVFGDGQQPWCALGSVKSQIGHTKAAAGAAGLIKSTLALYHKVLPPTIKVTQPRNELQQAGSPFYINAQSRPWLSGSAEPRRAGVSALGFGGSNYHCLLEEYTTEKQGNDWTQEVQWFALSADSREQLRANLDAIALSDDWNALRRVAAQSRQAFDAAADYRLCWVVQRSSDQAAQRQLILQALSREDSQWQTPDGVFFSARPCDGATAVLFPGQGATYPHMLHDLAMRFPAFFEVLEEADRYFPADDGRTLSEYIYPRASFDANGATQAANELQATDVAQPALGAVSLAGFALLRAFGLQVDACAGHSYGELSALCAAGVLRSDAFHRLSRVRGELMAAAANGGAMLAVFASLETIEAMIEEQGWDVVLANRNTPAQGVISGSTAAIATASAHLQAQGIGCKQLDVAAAFHSRFVSEAVAPLAQYLDNVDWQTPTSFVYANTTADIYPSDSDEARCLLAEQLAHPVDFVAQIEAMYQAGVRTFVEVGPHARLSAMVAAILGDRDYHTVALDASQGKQSGVYDFACMLARLSALGQPIDGTLWDEDLPPEPVVGKRVLRIPLCGANPFTPKPARPPRPRTVAAPATKETPVTVEQPKPTITPESKPVVQAAVSPRTPTQPQAAAMTPPVAMPEATLGQGVQALQDIQMQTARLHEQFLKGQEEATRAMMALLGGQVSVVSRQSPVASEQVASQQLSVASVQSPVVSEPVAVASRQSPVVSEQVAVASQQVPVVSEQAALSHDAVAETVFAIIAEKTGYPVDMLEADMSLDGDLGVDSIKRVEILSAVQMALPDAPVITPEDLGVLQTLGQMVAHLGVQSPVVSGQSSVVSRQSSVVSEQPAVAETVFAIIAEKTGYPVDMLEADMSLDGDLGVDSIKRVEILSAVQTALPDAPVITPEDLGVLQTLGQMVAHLGVQSPVVSGQSPVVSRQSPVVSEQPAVAETVFAIIAEKTGYPVDMLEADMSLDGDLGVDSIKRVEILSAVQTALPDAPVITPEDLGVLQTLGQMVAHLGVQSPVVSGQSSVVSEQPAVAETVFAIIAEKTGYPVDMLEADMSLDGDLGVDSIKRVEILSAVQTALPDAPAITPEHMGQLGSLADITAFLAQAPERSSVETTTSAGETTPEIAAPATIHRQCLTLLPWASEGLARISHPAGARCWLLAGDDDVAHSMEHSLQEAGYEVVVITPGSSPTPPESLHALFMIAPESAMTDSLMWQYFAVLQRAESALRATEHSILATVSRMDGQFGLSGLVHDPLSGGLHGMLKTAHHEWSEVRCTAFDIPADSHAIATASLLDAALVVDSPLEIACAPEGMSALYCYDAPVVESNEPLPVQAGDLVVVSGGGRGVTAHVAIALARATQATIMLLGRSPLHDEAAWLAGIDDEMAIKQALMQHSDSPLTPRDLAAAYRQVVAQREVRATMAAIEQAGGTVLYRSVDVTNANDVAWLIGEVRAEHGAVKGVIHGAGVLADRLIGDKTQDQFERVYNTKVAGLRALLDATKDDPLRFVLLFSSSTGRFGRRGQVDYAIANEVLNKHAQAIAVQRPDCRVMAPNWGPWDGGMVTPALKQVFAEEGIAVIDLDAGAAYVLQELRTPPGSDVEMVILGGNEAAPTPPADSQVANPRPAFIITQEEPAPATLKAEPSAWEMVVSLDDYPFLTSHVMNNQAVLPMAMMVEWMAYAAIHANPGLLFHGFEELRVLKAVTVQEQQARALRFVCEPMQTVDDNFHIAVSLHSQGDEDRLHARCTIVLREHYPSAPHAAPLPDLQAWPHPMHTVYQDGHLFHGPDLHALVEITGYADDAIHARVLTAPSPDQWIETPVSNQWLADPLALDGSFQLMILWAFERHNMGSLPVYAGAYQQYISHFPDDGVDVRIRISDVSGAQVEAAIEWIDPASGALLARMDDYRCVMDASLADSFQRTDLQHANEASNDAHHE